MVMVQLHESRRTLAILLQLACLTINNVQAYLKSMRVSTCLLQITVTNLHQSVKVQHWLW